MFGIFPACLPLQKRTENIGIHSGWSSPIPFYILSQFAPGFTKIYRDFFKQAHYKMDIMDRCSDANALSVTGEPAQFPTNTYYPPGKNKSFPKTCKPVLREAFKNKKKRVQFFRL